MGKITNLSFFPPGYFPIFVELLETLPETEVKCHQQKSFMSASQIYQQDTSKTLFYQKFK